MEILVILFVLLINFGLVYVIAKFIGKKRLIGFGWSLALGIVATPVLGLIITLLSPKIKPITPNEVVKDKKWVRVLLRVFGGFFIFFTIMYVILVVQLGIGSIWSVIWLGVLGIYLIECANKRQARMELYEKWRNEDASE